MKELRDLSNRDGKQINQINIWALRGHWSSWRSFTLVNLRIFKQKKYMYQLLSISQIYIIIINTNTHCMLWMHKPAYPSKSSTLHMFTDFQLPARPGSDSRSENLRPRHPCGKTQRLQASTSGPGLKMEGMGVWDMFTLFWQKRMHSFFEIMLGFHAWVSFKYSFWLRCLIVLGYTSTSTSTIIIIIITTIIIIIIIIIIMIDCWSHGWMWGMDGPVVIGCPTNLSIADLLSHFRSDHGSQTRNKTGRTVVLFPTFIP